MNDGFRIGRIWVEGFKGFSGSQQIVLYNRHLFLIGPNGNGKSSIIEAIRWGLFGSTVRRNEIVRNTGYGGDCRVEIALTRGGKEWRLSRTLTPGGGGGSRAALFDEYGKDHSIRDVLPQMDSLDAGEGTHIIFAPQSAPLRRQPEDLTPFERTVFSHLGLTHARAMLSHIATLVQEQEEEESSLETSIGDVRKRLDDQISGIEGQRGLILSSSPWDSDLPPSIADTEIRAKELIVAIRGIQEGEHLSQYSIGALLAEVEKALEEKIDLDRTRLETELGELNSRLIRLETIRDTFKNIVLKRKAIAIERDRLFELLDGLTIEELGKQLEMQRRNMGILGLKRRVGQIVSELLNRTDDGKLFDCPICESKCSRVKIERKVADLTQIDESEASEGLHEIEKLFANVEEIDSDVRQQCHELEERQRKLEELVAVEHGVEINKEIEDGGISNHIISAIDRVNSLQEQLEGFDDWRNGMERKVKNLHEEARYQELQQKLVKLNAVKADVIRVQEVFN